MSSFARLLALVAIGLTLCLAAVDATFPSHTASVPLSTFPLEQQHIRQQYLKPAFLSIPLLPTTYDTSPSFPTSCPCSNATLCLHLTTPDRPELFIFQVRTSDWHHYNYTHLTTIVACAGIDPALLCYAHAHNVRLTLITSYPPTQLTNTTARHEWLTQQLTAVKASYSDGVNVDFEDPLTATMAPHYTSLIAHLTTTLHAALPGTQVTVDVAWSPNCIDGRCYDALGLSKAADFLFVMSYDMRSQVYNLSDCVASANSPYQRVRGGLHNYTALAGVSAHKLVLGVPWYFYDYPCLNTTQPTDSHCPIQPVPFRGAPCSDAAGSERDYALYHSLLSQSTTGKRWSNDTQSWWFNYVDEKDGSVHQVWMDDVVSLSVKYRLIREEGLRGVGMWTADFLNYSMPLRETRDMWVAVGEAAAEGVVDRVEEGEVQGVTAQQRAVSVPNE